MNFKISINNSHLIISHFTGTAGVVGAFPLTCHEIKNLLICLNILSRCQLFTPQFIKGRLGNNLS